MKKAEISVGKTYVMKVSGKLVPVQVLNVCRFGGWYGINTVTKRDVRIHSAAKLRREYGVPTPAPLNKYGEAVFLHGPVCSECSQRIGKNTRFMINEVNQVNCWRCAGFAENESLESASVCLRCGNEAVAPKSLCCEALVVTPTMQRWYASKKVA
jgi:hypothetical protein